MNLGPLFKRTCYKGTRLFPLRSDLTTWARYYPKTPVLLKNDISILHTGKPKMDQHLFTAVVVSRFRPLQIGGR